MIMRTANAQPEPAVEALERGANDSITKPLDLPVALARIRAQIAEHPMRQPGGLAHASQGASAVPVRGRPRLNHASRLELSSRTHLHAAGTAPGS